MPKATRTPTTSRRAMLVAGALTLLIATSPGQAAKVTELNISLVLLREAAAHTSPRGTGAASSMNGGAA